MIKRTDNPKLEENPELEKSKKWFKNAGQGLFVHWGLYSIPAGSWNEKEIPWFGEWIMHSARIPISEYEKLTRKFCPLEFNAREWVTMAQDAGLNYIVFTSKHHDGFAMFNSETDKYNIVDATRFKRDPIAELAEACKEKDMKLALYYSQAMDWHEPHGANSINDEDYGNNWDFPYGNAEGFSEYMQRKVKPQIKELLTKYGPIAMMWFDNPMPSFTREHALDLKKLVRETQPGCLISNRIGHGLGDISGWGDNYVPEQKVDRLAEACITMNDTWGYKKTGGGRWKSTEELLQMIDHSKSHGYNLLINVGPMGNGKFPEEAVDRLKGITEYRKSEIN